MALKQIKTSELKKDDRFYTNLGKTQEYVCISTSPLRVRFYCEKPPASLMVQWLTVSTVYVEAEPDIENMTREEVQAKLERLGIDMEPAQKRLKKVLDKMRQKEAEPAEDQDVVKAKAVPVARWFVFINPGGLVSEKIGKCVVVSHEVHSDYPVRYYSATLQSMERCVGSARVRRIPNPIIAGQEAIEQRDKLVAALRNDEMADEMVKRCGSLASLPNLIFAEYRYNVLSAADIEKAEVE